MAFVPPLPSRILIPHSSRLPARRPRAPLRTFAERHSRLLASAEDIGFGDDFPPQPSSSSAPSSSHATSRGPSGPYNISGNLASSEKMTTTGNVLDAASSADMLGPAHVGSEALNESDEDDDEGFEGAVRLGGLSRGGEGDEIEKGESEFCAAEFLTSVSLEQYREHREAGLHTPLQSGPESEYNDAWALSVHPRKAHELRNQYSRVAILIERNFSDFEPVPGCQEVYANATLDEIALVKALAVYNATGMPAIAEVGDMSIDAPESGSRINKTLQQGYYTRLVEEEGDEMIDRVRPISDENRMTRFNSSVAYFDGEMEIVTNGSVNVAITFSGARYATIATAAALDELYKQLTRKLGLTLTAPDGRAAEGTEEGEGGKILVGATLLKERILREGKMLNDSIIKVSSFLNHMVDTKLMEMCGEELAERLRRTMPNKVLTVESTGLIAGLPTARKLGIPLVFARKSRPITISDSYQTSYRSATKGTTVELIVSCEYLEEGDRVLIIDDFLAGGSTAEALFRLARMARAKVVGVGVLIEKMSDGGRTFLSGYDVPVESLAKVLPGGEKGRVSVVEEEPWVQPGGSEGKKAGISRSKEEISAEAFKAEEEFYGRETDVSGLGEDDDDDDDAVKVIRWDEDAFDELEESLIREAGRDGSG